MSLPFDLGNLGNLMGGLQQSIERMKESAKNTQVEGVAGGGMVRVIATGDNQIVSIHISPEAYEDRELLEDLVRAATNEALRKVKDVLAKELSGIAGGLPIPPGLIPGL
jgi:nucleoid-associated protein EbfC